MTYLVWAVYYGTPVNITVEEESPVDSGTWITHPYKNVTTTPLFSKDFGNIEIDTTTVMDLTTFRLKLDTSPGTTLHTNAFKIQVFETCGFKTSFPLVSGSTQNDKRYTLISNPAGAEVDVSDRSAYLKSSCDFVFSHVEIFDATATTAAGDGTEVAANALWTSISDPTGTGVIKHTQSTYHAENNFYLKMHRTAAYGSTTIKSINFKMRSLC